MLKKSEATREWIWVDSQSKLSELIPELCSAGAVSLDTEFHRERTYFPKLALVQIGWNDKVALLDPFSLDLTALGAVFSSPTEVILHAGTQDLDILSRIVGVLPQSIFDTQLAAGFIGFSNPSLAVLSEKLLGVLLPKGDRLTDWTKRPLTESQLRYAASDVVHLIKLKAEIERQLGLLGRVEWACDESKLLLEKDRTGIPAERAWWKIKECRHLKGDSRKVAQALAAWRELRAAGQDVPVRYILSDLAIAVISQELPRAAEDLGALRGVEPRFLSHGVDREIIEVVSEGRFMADSDLCLPMVESSDKRLKPIASLAITWVTQLAQSLKIDPLLLATRSDIAGFLNGDEDSRIASGWRNAVLGEPITKLARGELALAVSTSGELELEQRSYLRYSRDI